MSSSVIPLLRTIGIHTPHTTNENKTYKIKPIKALDGKGLTVAPSQQQSLISSANPFKFAIRAAIPLQASGTVLGRGGASIKELQDRSGGCKIQLAETLGDAHNTKERLALFSGPSAQLVAQVQTA